MQDSTIFTLDADAIKFGGKKGGLYLDMLGKTDLATLTGPEWQDFLTYVVEGAWRFSLDRHLTQVEAKEPKKQPLARGIGDDEIPF